MAGTKKSTSVEMRVLVLGAGGQLGSRIARHLKRNSTEVVGTGRREGIRFDPLRDDWQRLGHFDVLINCIGAIEGTFTSYTACHIEIPKRILDNRDILGAPRVIHLSALGARSNHPSSFLATKAEGDELLIEALGEEVSILRPSIVCTPGTRVVEKILRIRTLARLTGGRVPVTPSMLTQRLQPLLVDDLLLVIQELVGGTRRASVLELGGKEVFHLRDLFSLAFATGGLTFHPRVISQAFFRSAVRSLPSSLSNYLISPEELLLLNFDNVVGTRDGEQYIGRETSPFFRSAFETSERESHLRTT